MFRFELRHTVLRIPADVRWFVMRWMIPGKRWIEIDRFGIGQMTEPKTAVSGRTVVEQNVPFRIHMYDNGPKWIEK